MMTKIFIFSFLYFLVLFLIIPISTYAQPRDIQHIAYGSDPLQFGELQLPEGSGPYPLVIMIHGGCWQASLPGVSLMGPIAEDLRKSGYAVWNLEYRRLGYPEGGYPGTFLDIAQGVDYARTLGITHNLDLSHVTIIGHSAGGQLALWASGRTKILPTSRLYTPNPLAIASVISLAGINDLKAYHDKGPMACGGPITIERLINLSGRTHEDPYADTSPTSLLPLHVSQIIISGTLDPIVPSQFCHSYAEKARAKGDSVTTIDIENSGHFELIDPQSAAWIQIKKNISVN